MPLMDLSASTSLLTSSRLGPSPVNGTGIMLMPKVSQSLKCRSYPGTGHKTETRSLAPQGPAPLPSTNKKDKYWDMRERLLLPPAHTRSSVQPKICEPNFLHEAKPVISP